MGIQHLHAFARASQCNIHARNGLDDIALERQMAEREHKSYVSPPSEALEQVEHEGYEPQIRGEPRARDVFDLIALDVKDSAV
jgi:hypothetical protein